MSESRAEVIIGLRMTGPDMFGQARYGLFEVGLPDGVSLFLLPGETLDLKEHTTGIRVVIGRLPMQAVKVKTRLERLRAAWQLMSGQHDSYLFQSEDT